MHLLWTLVVQQSFFYQKENVIVTTGAQYVHSSLSHESEAIQTKTPRKEKNTNDQMEQFKQIFLDIPITLI